MYEGRKRELPLFLTFQKIVKTFICICMCSILPAYIKEFKFSL